MMSGWLVLSLLVVGTALLFLTVPRRRSASPGLDRAFHRAQDARESGVMNRDRLY